MVQSTHKNTRIKYKATEKEILFQSSEILGADKSLSVIDLCATDMLSWMSGNNIIFISTNEDFLCLHLCFKKSRGPCLNLNCMQWIILTNTQQQYKVC